MYRGIAPAVIPAVQSVTESFIRNYIIDFTQGSIPSGFTFSRASTATNETASGWTQVSNDVPAFMYNSTTGKSALYLEPAATNLLYPSSSYSSYNTTISGTDNSGGFYASVISENSSTVPHIIFNNNFMNYADFTNRFLTASVYIKYLGRQYVALFMDDFSTNGIYAYFDILNGTLIGKSELNSATVLDANIEYVRNGFYRISVYGKVTSSYGARVSLMSSDDTTLSWYKNSVGLNSTAFAAYGLQLEDGDIRSSYIDTVSSAVTRSQANLVANGTSVVFANKTLKITYSDGTTQTIMQGASNTLLATQGQAPYAISKIEEV